MLQEILIISNNASNKSYWELKFLQKTQGVHMFISYRNGSTSYKDGFSWNIITYWKETVDSLYNWMLQKISVTSKDASNKN